MSLRTKLQGTGVALVTPFKTNGDVDFNALGKVIDFVIDGGIEYVIMSFSPTSTFCETDSFQIK